MYQNHNDHEAHSLNTKYIFQWTSSGRFRMQWFQWQSGRILVCHVVEPLRSVELLLKNLC